MPVASVQDEVVAEDQRRDPQVVNGSRRPLTAKVAAEQTAWGPVWSGEGDPPEGKRDLPWPFLGAR